MLETSLGKTASDEHVELGLLTLQKSNRTFPYTNSVRHDLELLRATCSTLEEGAEIVSKMIYNTPAENTASRPANSRPGFERWPLNSVRAPHPD
jgi:hypothetical protein